MNASAVRDHLVSLGVTTGATTAGTAWVCLIGGLSDKIGAPQVAVMDRGGLPPLGSHDSVRPLRPGVQVLVRGLPNSYAATATKAQAVFDALHGQRFGSFMDVRASQSPLWLGFLDDDRPTWSLNFDTFQE